MSAARFEVSRSFFGRSTLLAGLSTLALGCDTQSDALSPLRVERGWRVVWEDGFEGPAGGAVDANKWVLDLGRGEGGWGNNELQSYTARPENIALSGDGFLEITARKEALGGAEYTSARMKTEGRFTQTYGRVEARMKLPTGAGLWPAFWMLGENYTSEGWPHCGEIDIMEYRGQSPDIVVGSLHGPGYFGGNPITDVYFLPDGDRFDEDFHVFAVEWDPGRVAWYVDDTLFQVATANRVPSGGQWVFDHPFFVILNLAVGGNFVGSPSPSTVFPQKLVVDYVRVLERTP